MAKYKNNDVISHQDEDNKKTKKVGISKNVFILDRDINGDVYLDFAKFIKKSYEQKNHPPITLIINSCGGRVLEALDICNLILSYPGETTGIVIGACKSSANIVFASCKKRFSLPYSRFAFHSVSSSGPFKYNADLEKNIDLFTESIKKLKEKWEKIHLDAGISKEMLKEISAEGDLFDSVLMFPEEFLGCGFVHEIITELPF